MTPVFVHRPEDGVHPPAAGLDPQLSPGGAEVIVSAGRLGQDVSATLRHQQLLTGSPPRLTASDHTVPRPDLHRHDDVLHSSRGPRPGSRSSLEC